MRFISIILFILLLASGVSSEDITLDDVSSMAWSPDGSKLAIGYFNGSFEVLLAENMSLLFAQPPKNKSIMNLAWDSTNSKLAVVFSYYGTEIWDITNMQQTKFINGVGMVTWSNDNNYIFMGTPSLEFASLRKYDVNTGNIVLQSDDLLAMKVIPSSDEAFAVSYGTLNIIMFSLADFSLLKTFRLNDEETPSVFSIALSPNDQLVVGGYSDNKVRVWDIVTEQVIATLDGGGLIDDYTLISKLSFNSTGSRLYSISRTGGIRTWDTTTWELIEAVDIDALLTGNANFLPNAQSLSFVERGENVSSIIIRDLCDFVAPDVTSLLNIMPQANTFGEEAQICLTENTTYTLTAPLPDITGDITIIGNGATITMTGQNRIFNVLYNQQWSRNGSLTLKNVTLSGGIADEGGAIYNAGDLTLENVTLQNHTAVRGGAIYNTGNLVMNGGVIQNNTATEFGGGIYNLGDMQLDGVTIRQNTAPQGSGVYQG